MFIIDEKFVGNIVILRASACSKRKVKVTSTVVL